MSNRIVRLSVDKTAATVCLVSTFALVGLVATTAPLSKRFTGRLVFEGAPKNSVSLMTLNIYTVDAEAHPATRAEIGMQ